MSHHDRSKEGDEADFTGTAERAGGVDRKEGKVQEVKIDGPFHWNASEGTVWTSYADFVPGNQSEATPSM